MKLVFYGEIIILTQKGCSIKSRFIKIIELQETNTICDDRCRDEGIDSWS